jgi:uncharacterized membrane protein
MQQRKVTPPSPGDEDRDMIVRKAELFISNMLRDGVLLSAAIIVMGVIMFFARYSMNVADAHPFPHSLGAVISGIARADARSVIVLGLLVLLMTPVLRVAVSIVAFAIERDWCYVVITAIVLCVLLLSFFLGRGGA